MAAFARRLHALMMDKGLTQSDVASQIWGKTTNTKGHTVAKGRDRISEYVRGNSVPEPRNLRRLADVLGVTVEQLAPERAGSVLDRDDPALKMSAAAGQPGHVHLHINQTVPLGVAAEIIRLIGQSPAGARP
jgi:transcriptional regulator with XRE-family HTH domain